MKLKAKTTDAVSPLEQAGKNLARTIAQSGMVLLQNNGVLPLQPGLAGGTLDKDALRRSAARMIALAKED